MRKNLKFILIFILAWLAFIIIFYVMKNLVEAGQPVFVALNGSNHVDIQVWHIGVICMAMIVAACLVFLLQLLKSIWDAAFKKVCDDAAKAIVDWIRK